MIVSTSSGRLRTDVVDGILHARGVPYAEAPRFGNPIPVDTPTVERDATRRGPVCVQAPSRMALVTGPMTDGMDLSEDCLVLTVTAPSPPPADGLAVMVWFHGGAYVSGGGEVPKYDATPLAREGVVVVNVTYRLGVLGYHGRTPDTANLGMKDQIEALRWVRTNIERFGGDPSVITVFGQSAGGDSILEMMRSSGTDGLFHRAIVQSAPLGLHRGRLRMQDAVERTIAAHLGDRGDVMEAPGLLAIQEEVERVATSFGVAGGMPFGPDRRRAPMRTGASTSLAGRAAEIDLLIGTTAQDAAPFVALDPRIRRLDRTGVAGRAAFRVAVAAVTRRVFGVGEIVAIWEQAGGRVATYRFDWSPANSRLGACHCIELPMLFGGDWSDAPMLRGRPVPETLAQQMRRTWTDFAKRGPSTAASRRIVFA